MVENFGSKPQDLFVALGPGIHKESYQKEEVLQSDSPDWQKYLSKEINGLTSIDMYSYNKQQLLDSGILKQNIFISDVDTYLSKELFSHHRSEVKQEPEGRHAMIVYLVKN
jgi:copper oxidase (laccase) domain-containing protein